MVAELFGIFPAWLFDLVLPASATVLSASESVEAYQEALGRWARAHLAGVEEPDRSADLLQRVVECVDASGLALFAGWQRAVWPQGDVERVAHGLMVLREYCGGVHFAALRAVG